MFVKVFDHKLSARSERSRLRLHCGGAYRTSQIMLLPCNHQQLNFHMLAISRRITADCDPRFGDIRSSPTTGAALVGLTKDTGTVELAYTSVDYRRRQI